ncbi:unnamed protein product [Pocillopora meandrina]|uniref:Uncharacterized protein n=1 Tax=Pocillopora meandrina TaxID=46732 RepID=A0AAU9W5B7_9CNID|nr:unnamed protein product [Pocillopora meandrina]
MDANQGNFEAAVKPDSAKITPRKLTCSTVERWKTQDLVLCKAGSWLTYDSEETKRGHHCAALKCTESHFQDPLQQHRLQASQLQVVSEWHDMPDYTVQYLSPSPHYRAIWYKLFHSSRALEWQNILLFICLLFTLPVSNVALERIISNLGRVKTAKRASLSQGTLQDPKNPS